MEEKVRKSLLDQLSAAGKSTDYNKSLIEDYMKYYELKEKLMRDINENRGLIITQKSGNGFERKIINESVAEVQKITRLMLSIVRYLGLNDEGIEEEIDLREFY